MLRNVRVGYVLYRALVIIAILSHVQDEQRTLALDLQSLLFRAFGSIPGPIIFGIIIDSACLFWQFDCDRRGNCWVYNESLGNRAMALALCEVAFNFSFSLNILLTWLVYPKSKSKLEVEKKKADNPAKEVIAFRN